MYKLIKNKMQDAIGVIESHETEHATNPENI